MIERRFVESENEGNFVLDVVVGIFSENVFAIASRSRHHRVHRDRVCYFRKVRFSKEF